MNTEIPSEKFLSNPKQGKQELTYIKRYENTNKDTAHRMTTKYCKNKLKQLTKHKNSKILEKSCKEKAIVAKASQD